MTLNVEKLVELRDQLVLHPEQHDQNTWVNTHGETITPDEQPDMSCGTTACAAGWTVLLNGERFADYGTVLADTSNPSAYRQHVYRDGAFTLRLVVSVPERAQQILGLNDQQAEQLFYLERDKVKTVKHLDELIQEGLNADA